MTALLQDAILESTGKVLIKGALNVTLNNSYSVQGNNGILNLELEDALLVSSGSGYYYCNKNMEEYLFGKNIFSNSQDYRGYYFTTNGDLMNAVDIMPNWYLILKVDLWK